MRGLSVVYTLFVAISFCSCLASGRLSYTPGVAALQADDIIVRMHGSSAARDFVRQSRRMDDARNDVGVSFVHCDFVSDPKLWRRVALALRRMPRLRSLESKFSSMVGSGAGGIAAIVSGSPYLGVVSVVGTPLQAVDTRALAYSCIKHPTLTRISLRGCHLDDDAVKYVAYAVRHNHNVTHVDVSMNDISGAGVQCLAEILDGYDDGLEALDLSYNAIGRREGANHLAELLQYGLPNLQHLSLRGCDLDASQLAVVLSAIANRQKSLSSLDVGGNRLVVAASSEAKKKAQSIKGSIQRMLDQWMPVADIPVRLDASQPSPSRKKQRARQQQKHLGSPLKHRRQQPKAVVYDLTVDSKAAITVLTAILRKMSTRATYLGLASTGWTFDAIQYLQSQIPVRISPESNESTTAPSATATVLDLRLNRLQESELSVARTAFSQVLESSVERTLDILSA